MSKEQKLVRTCFYLATTAVLLACLVVSLGAFTRLVHAGLGCPDWPGCYGHLTWPTTGDEIAAAEALFPESPVETDKTWPEMVHRYCAGALGLLLVGLTVTLIRAQKAATLKPLNLPVKHSLVILGVIVIQAAFGMWTVTLKLWPQVVTAHLLGGFTTLALIWFLRLRLKHILEQQSDHQTHFKNSDINSVPNGQNSSLRKLFIGFAALVVLQISLGGWTSANYAALSCPDLPTCQGQWLPEADFQHGFNIAQHIGPNYLGGRLDGPGRTAIHLSHRVGAIIVTLVGLFAIWQLFRVRVLNTQVCLLLGLLITQVSLGLANIIFALPLAVAVAHNGVAALLLLAILTTIYRLSFITKTQTHKATQLGRVHHEPANQPAL